MRRLTLVLLGILLLFGAVRTASALDVPVGSDGSVNLTAYCTASFGSTYFASRVSPGAGGFVCQNRAVASDRRPISVQTACVQQYPKYARWVKAKAVGDGWQCIWVYPERSVDLTLYCSKHYGSNWRAVLHGPTSGDWSCATGTGGGGPAGGPNGGRGLGTLQPISVLDACKEQWYDVYKAQAVPPSGWVCVLYPEGA